MGQRAELRMRRAMPGSNGVLERAPQALARKVRVLRELLGLSQEELAERAGTSQGAVSRLESGGCSEMTLRIVVGVIVALVIELLPMREQCSAEVEALIGAVTGTFPLIVENKEYTVFRDPGLVSLVRSYTQLGATQRRRMARILGPLFELASESQATG